MEEPTPPRLEDVDPALAETLRQVVHGEHPVVRSVVIGESAIRQALGDAVADEMRKKGRRHVVLRKPVVAGPRVGRNEPCLCGSGKKFKKCCG